MELIEPELDVRSILAQVPESKYDEVVDIVAEKVSLKEGFQLAARLYQIVSLRF